MREPAGCSSTERTPTEQRAVGETLDSVTEFYEAIGEADSPAARLAAEVRERSAGLSHAGDTPYGRRFGSNAFDEE